MKIAVITLKDRQTTEVFFKHTLYKKLLKNWGITVI